MTTPVPIPARMRHLPVDRRGYPVPVIVMRDKKGAPIFAANDEIERQRVISEDRCQICGDRLNRGRWFVGGQLSVCAEHGLNLDSGMHDECAHYALRVCPYLAARNYSGLVGQRQLEHSDRRDVIVVETGTEQNTRPELFVAVMAVGQELRRGGILPGVAEVDIVYGVRPKLGSIRKVEVWRHGVELTGDELTLAFVDILNAVEAADDLVREDVLDIVARNAWSTT